MIEILEWLSDNGQTVVVLGSLISAISTLAIAVLTVFLWWENRALRKAGSEPNIVSHFEIHSGGSGAVDISLSNVGKGPAIDVSFTILADPDNFRKYDIKISHDKDRPAITLIPQSEKFTFHFAIGYHLVYPKGRDAKEGIDPLNPFTINVKWKNALGKCYSKNYLMDIMQFDDLPGIFEKPPLLKIVDSLDNIGQEIGGLRKQANDLRELVDTTVIRDCALQKTMGNPVNKS
ncbi:hypothetical protein [Nitrincola sp.]|uniref:hypothetical protein n=1 Tax=Nitrincola sp. TaxID=1926584 RepID=UPI003A955A7E